MEEETCELNRHTNAIDFHGNTYYAVALGHFQRAQEPVQQNVAPNKYMHYGVSNHHPLAIIGHSRGQGGSGKSKTSLISDLHIPGFHTSQLQTPIHDGEKYLTEYTLQGNASNNRFYFEYAHAFMDGYFKDLDCIHPLIDKERFVLRAHNLWYGKDLEAERSFIPLYLSLLSLGALICDWDHPRLGGLTRFEWSRKLLVEAQGYLNTWCFTNSLEIVQALYLMVCLLPSNEER